jgi:hypothetical protein
MVQPPNYFSTILALVVGKNHSSRKYKRMVKNIELEKVHVNFQTKFDPIELLFTSLFSIFFIVQGCTLN